MTYLQQMVERSLKLITKNISVLAPLALIFIVSSLLSTWYSTTYSPEEFRPIPLLLESILLSIVSYIFTKKVLRLAEGKPASLKDLNLSFSEGVRYFIISTLYFLLVMVGFILLIIPGFYFSLKYFFVPIIILDKNISIKEAWSQAAKLTEGKKLKLLPFILINMVLLVLIPVLSGSNLRYLSSIAVTILECILYTVISVEIYLQYKSKA